jgi:hypothetical protein
VQSFSADQASNLAEWPKRKSGPEKENVLQNEAVKSIESNALRNPQGAVDACPGPRHGVWIRLNRFGRRLPAQASIHVTAATIRFI